MFADCGGFMSPSSRGEKPARRGGSQHHGTRRRYVAAVAVVTLAAGMNGIVWATSAPRDVRLALAMSTVIVLVCMLSAGAAALVVARRLIRGMRAGQRELVREIQDVRAKQSRHEYLQETALTRLERAMEQVRADSEAQHAALIHPRAEALAWSSECPGDARVLFVTSNGAGMGHLSRCLAVAAAAGERFSTAILTLSSAYETVARAGFPVRHYESPDTSPWSREQWNRRFAAYLQAMVDVERPALVVFDGVVVYRGITEVCRRTGTPLVWMRRGLWKAAAGSCPARDLPYPADAVIVPGEIGADTNQLEGGAALYHVGPITQARRSTAASRLEALETFGLDPAGRYALVQVGSAVLDGAAPVPIAVSAIRAAGAVEPVVFVSPVIGRQPPVGAVSVTGRYPLAPYLSAFDFAVTAAGYNSVYENLEMRLPSVFLPNTSTMTDDQEARARLAAASGCALVATTPAELSDGIECLSSAAGRASIAAQLSRLPELGGAKEAADILSTLIARYRATPTTYGAGGE